MTAPRRHWFRFSLRTLFVAVTALAGWLGYELHWIRERHEVRRVLESRGGGLQSGDEYKAAVDEWQRFVPETEKIRSEIPWVRRILGDVPVVIINAPIDRLSEQELSRIRRAFPEAFVALMVAATYPPLPEVAEEPDWRDEVEEALRKPLDSHDQELPATPVVQP